MAITSTGNDDGQDKKKKKRKTRGRQKIEIKKIQKKSNLHVTFSKRRNGLMKKASEISVLCGAEVALVALSPEEKKVFAFGHPDLESVLARHTNPSLSANSHKSKQAATASIEKLKREYEESLQKLQEEKKKKKAENREELRKGSENTMGGGFWWEEPVDDMGVQELEDYKNALLQLRRNAACKFNQRYGDSYTVNSLVAGDISHCPRPPPHAWSSPKLPRWTTDSGIPEGFGSF